MNTKALEGIEWKWVGNEKNGYYKYYFGRLELSSDIF